MDTETASTSCPVCEKQFSSWVTYEQHNDSPAHRKAVENRRQIENLAQSLKNPSSTLDEVNLETLDEFMMTEDKNLYFCKLCQVPCSGKIPALNHCLGKSHRKQKQRHQFSMTPAGHALTFSDSGSSSFSGVTDVSTSSPHIPISGNGILSGATNLELSSEFSVFQTNPLTGHFLCTVCNLSVSGVIPAEQHIKGRAHMKKAKRKSAMNSFETSGNSSDLESQFSRLDVSDSKYEPNKFTEEEEIRDNEKNSKLQENPLSSTLNKLHDNLNVQHDDQTSARNVDGQTEGKGQGDERDLEVDKVTGHAKCKVCQVTLTGEEPIKQHLVGKPHQKKKKAASIDQGSSQWSSLVSNDFSLPDRGTLLASPHEIKGGMPKEMPNPYHSQSKAVTGPPRNQDTNLAGPQISPYLVQQHTMKTDGVSSYSHHDRPESEASKDALARGNLELAKHLSSPTPLGANVASSYDHKGVRSNPPMSDFLQHQRNSGSRSDMGNFWSMQSSSTDSHNLNNAQADRCDGDTTKINTAKPECRVDPIGTPPHISKSGVQGATSQTQRQDPMKEFFTVEPRTGKLLCRVCDVSVSGAEPARQHLQGKSHIKKQRAYEFNQNHMAPFTSSPATPDGYEGPHQMGHHGPPGLHREGFPSNNSTQASHQSTASSSPRQQHVHPHYAGNMNAGHHQRNPYHGEQYCPPFQQQGDVVRAPHPDQYNIKPHSVGYPPSSQSQSLYHSARSPPRSQQNITSVTSSQSQGLYHSSRSPPQSQQHVTSETSSQSQGFYHSTGSPPQSQQHVTSETPNPYQGTASPSLAHLDNYSFSSSSSHHSSSQFSDDMAHSLRGVSLPENH